MKLQVLIELQNIEQPCKSTMLSQLIPATEKFGELISPFTKSELVQILLPSKEDNSINKNNIINIENIQISIQDRIVKLNNLEVHLTPIEFKLLSLLAERRGIVQSRSALLQDVWNINPNNNTRTVDTHVRRVRNKLGPTIIQTVSGVGYIIR